MLTNQDVDNFIQTYYGLELPTSNVNGIKYRVENDVNFRRHVMNFTTFNKIKDELAQPIVIDNTKFEWKDFYFFSQNNETDYISSDLTITTEFTTNIISAEFNVELLNDTVNNFLVRVKHNRDATIDLIDAGAMIYTASKNNLFIGGPVDIYIRGSAVQVVFDWLEHFTYYISTKQRQF